MHSPQVSLRGLRHFAVQEGWDERVTVGLEEYVREMH